jgi:hypothetical protein
MDTADNIVDNLSNRDFEIAVKMFDKGNEREALKYVLAKTTLDEQDAQLALPEPPTRDYLGDDGKDYEGGMAKSQLLKMKNYADKLCNMVDDESQLEAWVQAKLTKASDYMSAVFHYLDYQNSKMNESYLFPRRVPREEWEQLDIEWEMTDYVERRPDYREGPLEGTTEDGRKFESNGYYTEFEGIVVIDDVYEVT